MNEEISPELKCMKLCAEIMVDTVLCQNAPRGLVHLLHEEPEREAIVVVIIGKEQVDKILPSLKRLCPEDVVVEGKQVKATKTEIEVKEHADH